MEKKTFLPLTDADREKINEDFVSRLGFSEKHQKEMLDAMSDEPKLILDAEWEINYWKSGSGFSHSEVVEHSVEEVVLAPDEMKKALKNWWYENGWTDTEYDRQLLVFLLVTGDFRRIILVYMSMMSTNA